MSLGSRIQLNGDISKEVKTRVGMAAGKLNSLKHTWNRRKSLESNKSKIYNACVRNVLLYGFETWPIEESDINRMEAFESKCLQNILNNGYNLPT